jgi:hypothetical protein
MPPSTLRFSPAQRRYAIGGVILLAAILRAPTARGSNARARQRASPGTRVLRGADRRRRRRALETLPGAAALGMARLTRSGLRLDQAAAVDSALTAQRRFGVGPGSPSYCDLSRSSGSRAKAGRLRATPSNAERTFTQVNSPSGHTETHQETDKFPLGVKIRAALTRGVLPAMSAGTVGGFVAVAGGRNDGSARPLAWVLMAGAGRLFPGVAFLAEVSRDRDTCWWWGGDPSAFLRAFLLVLWPGAGVPGKREVVRWSCSGTGP